MPVIYNSHSIIPGPFLEITKRFARGEDGGLRRKSFGLALKGSMLDRKSVV